ncbi:hypothetical protein OG401_03525 [Kitasatospora purpeofusca]|uniref:hypothetical protein n=1 Tax=Kitasatospora purpeofusca TaxID=67352 RepID=UPI0022565571|nr:hypothetical protein [Kitasatospora purpeofusca]MCX4683383.1 hypothetical protein [Kitasatospora purpeofusca]
MAGNLTSAHYHRLEPAVRATGSGGQLTEALEAGVADPLFLLARQWQLAEFAGEDDGSPVCARLEVTGAAVNRFRPGDDGAPLPLGDAVPLEYLVEAGGPAPELTLRDAARAGLRFLSGLGALSTQARAHIARAAVARFPLGTPPAVEGVRDPDPAGRALAAALAVRAPHGGALAEGLAAGWHPDGLTADQTAAFDRAATRWQSWFTTEHTAPAPSSWVSERLEHRFSVGARLGGEQLVLTAPEYPGGRIEPYHLDLDTRPGGSLDAPASADPPVTVTTLPTRATYPGMPADRWWEFEDTTVNLPAIDAGPPDLARLLVVEYANVYGSDHWIVPIDLPVGRVYRVTGFTVVDTFGEAVPLGPADDGGWSVFRPADLISGKPGPPLLPLLATVADPVEGAAVEEVVFARDELANLGWAVERTVRGATGRARPRCDEIPDEDPPTQAPGTGALDYRLMTGVPPHWIPLVPVPLREGSTAIRFRRGQVPRFTADGHPRPQVAAVGRILEPATKPWYVHDEEVPRSGLTVSRTPVAARGPDGAVLHWTGRRARPGLGELSSGLAFDAALPSRGGTP